MIFEGPSSFQIILFSVFSKAQYQVVITAKYSSHEYLNYLMIVSLENVIFYSNSEIHRKGEYILAIVKLTKIFQSLYLIENCSLKSFIFLSLGKSMIWLQQTAANMSNA